MVSFSVYRQSLCFFFLSFFCKGGVSDFVAWQTIFPDSIAKSWQICRKRKTVNSTKIKLWKIILPLNFLFSSWICYVHNRKYRINLCLIWIVFLFILPPQCGVSMLNIISSGIIDFQYINELSKKNRCQCLQCLH